MADVDREQSLKNRLTIFIALAAMTSALVSWRGMRTAGAASGADGKAITAALDEAATEFGIASDTFANLTDTREYLVHAENGRAINEEYMRNPDIPGHWLDEWQSEMIRARSRHVLFNFDYINTEGGLPVFEKERYRETARALAASEKALDIEPFIEKAAGLRRTARLLFSLNALFSSALFFFTVALKADVRRKSAWTAAGIVLYAAGAIPAVILLLG